MAIALIPLGKTYDHPSEVFGPVRQPVRRTHQRALDGKENSLRFLTLVQAKAACDLSYESSALTN